MQSCLRKRDVLPVVDNSPRHQLQPQLRHPLPVHEPGQHDRNLYECEPHLFEELDARPFGFFPWEFWHNGQMMVVPDWQASTTPIRPPPSDAYSLESTRTAASRHAYDQLTDAELMPPPPKPARAQASNNRLSSGLWKCEGCSRPFTTRAHLNRHKRKPQDCVQIQPKSVATPSLPSLAPGISSLHLARVRTSTSARAMPSARSPNASAASSVINDVSNVSREPSPEARPAHPTDGMTEAEILERNERFENLQMSDHEQREFVLCLDRMEYINWWIVLQDDANRAAHGLLAHPHTLAWRPTPHGF